MIVLLIFLKLRAIERQEGGHFSGWLTKPEDRPSIVLGSLSSPNNESPYFAYVVIDSDNYPFWLPAREIVRNDWGDYFAGRRIPRVDDEFYLAIYKDDRFLFFDKVDDDWIQHKFSSTGQITKDDLKTICKELGANAQL